jgi:hypothetical protein
LIGAKTFEQQAFVQTRDLRGSGTAQNIARSEQLLRTCENRDEHEVALEHYTQAIPEAKYAAQARVLEMIFGKDCANGTFRHMAVSQTVN